MFKKALLFCLVGWGAYVIWQLGFSQNLFPSNAKEIAVKLTQRPFTVFAFPSKKPETKAIILFASGDGGWSTLEEAIGEACQDHGYTLIGIDSESYAKTDYDLDILQSDFNTIARITRAPFEKKAPPLILGGYSMGAAQAVAAAGGPNPPEGLVGLLVIDMLSRGRYGLRTADQLNVLPTGAGTFGVQDFSPALSHLRVVQWHAEDDSIDSITWLDSLTAQHREFTFPGAGHGYESNRATFIREFVDSIAWILNPNETASKAALSHE